MNFVDGVLLRFSLVGLGNTLVGLFVIYALKIIGFGDVSANAIGYTCGFAMGFILNKNWTFKCRRSTYSALLRFGLVIAVAYFANLATVIYLIENQEINGFLSQSVGIPIYAIVSYLGCRFFVFNQVGIS